MSASSSTTSDNKDTESGSSKRSNTNFIWSNWPSISIMLPPQGSIGREIDERCFTYCSQTVRGRMNQQDPSCRSICLRRVFLHEVRRVMSIQELQTAARKHEKEHGRFPFQIDPFMDVKYPLPAEGQRAKQEPRSMSLQDATDDALADEDSSSSSSSRDEDKARYWEPGWYLWSTKTRWAVQEHIDMMRRDLKSQEEWNKYKDEVNKKWKKLQHGHEQPDDHVKLPRRNIWFPDITDTTFLVPVPPPQVVIGAAINKYLEPTRKLLDIVHESIASGHQQELAKRMLEKAWTPEPWILVRNVCSKMWKIWNEGPPDDDDGEETNKGGKF